MHSKSELKGSRGNSWCGRMLVSYGILNVSVVCTLIDEGSPYTPLTMVQPKKDLGRSLKWPTTCAPCLDTPQPPPPLIPILKNSLLVFLSGLYDIGCKVVGVSNRGCVSQKCILCAKEEPLLWKKVPAAPLTLLKTRAILSLSLSLCAFLRSSVLR